MGEIAVPPTAGFSTSFMRINTEQQEIQSRMDQSDDMWKSLGDHPAYKHALKPYIERLIEGLDELEGKAFENGASLEEIGLRRAVNRLTKANLKSIITKVEQTAETLNAQKRGRDEGSTGTTST